MLSQTDLDTIQFGIALPAFLADKILSPLVGFPDTGRIEEVD